MLGASVPCQADTEHLTEAYNHFKVEAQNLSAQYAPKTVNIDGWTPSQSAWYNLFSSITIILCFFHAFIKIRKRCKHMQSLFHELTTEIWNIYRAPNKSMFMKKMQAFKVWTIQTMHAGAGREAILSLCGKAPAFAKTSAHPSAYRTSNMLDRIIDQHDRYLYGGATFTAIVCRQNIARGHGPCSIISGPIVPGQTSQGPTHPLFTS